ncbi:MAG: hypothetical protein CFH00_00953 [Alphaproteobacteria bacterium MarineAlpha1_Bin1]|nr:MAG: hypothetical protein CFH00_00953 [Alphaproteobacteria bacterium MarineAlpha1_Bin1]
MAFPKCRARFVGDYVFYNLSGDDLTLKAKFIAHDMGATSGYMIRAATTQ